LLPTYLSLELVRVRVIKALVLALIHTHPNSYLYFILR